MDRHVIVICEECGRKYRVDSDRILGRAAGFSCRSCGHRIRVVKPDPPPPSPAAEEPPPAIAAAEPEIPNRPPFRSSGLGLKSKAWFFGFLVPLTPLMALAGLVLVGDRPTGGIGSEEFLLLCGGLSAALAIGLAYGLRLAGRIGRLAAAAERVASGAEEPPPAPQSGDDLDRIAAAVSALADPVRSKGEARGE